jgi:hypothetical protein
MPRFQAQLRRSRPHRMMTKIKAPERRVLVKLASAVLSVEGVHPGRTRSSLGKEPAKLTLPLLMMMSAFA